MILLQASIIWSAGVVSVVQSGPSWLRACAKAGADQRVAASRQSATSRRRIGGGPVEERRLLVARKGKVVHGLAVVHTAVGAALSPYSLSGQILLRGVTQSFCSLRPTS